MGRGTDERLSNSGEQIDVVCSRFIDLLESGAHAKIDDFIAGWDEPERTKLLSELLLVVIDFRWRKVNNQAARTIATLTILSSARSLSAGRLSRTRKPPRSASKTRLSSTLG